MDPTDNNKERVVHNPLWGKNPAKPQSRKAVTLENVAVAAAVIVPRSSSVDSRPDRRLSRQPNVADLHRLLQTEAGRDQDSADRIPRAFSSMDPYSPPPTPHSTSPLSTSGSTVPPLLPPASAETQHVILEEQHPAAAAAAAAAVEAGDSPQLRTLPRIPRFLADVQSPLHPLLPPLNLSLLPIQTVGSSAAAAAAAAASNGVSQRSSKDQAVGFLGDDQDTALRAPRTPTSADRNRATTPKGKANERLPDHVVRKNSAEEAAQVQAGGRERRSTPRRTPRLSNDDALPILMARSAPVICRTLSVQDRDNITQRLDERLKRRNDPTERETRSVFKHFVRDNTEGWRARKEQNSYKDLKKEIKPLSSEITDNLLKSPVILEHLINHLSDSLGIIVSELESFKRAQQIQSSETWGSTQNFMDGLAQKLAAVKALPTPEALADLLKCMNGTSESLRRTLDSASSLPQAKLEPGEDWNRCISTLRDIIHLFQRFDVPLPDKLRFFKENSRKTFEDKKIRDIFDLIMRPLVPCCECLEGYCQKNLVNTVKDIAEKALKDCEAFAQIPTKQFEWIEPPKEKLKDGDDPSRNRRLNDLQPCATLRTLFTHKSISVNDCNFDDIYRSIPRDDFTQKFEGPNIPQSIQNYYLSILCSIYKRGFSAEFNAIEDETVRNQRIQQFAQQQLQRIIENKLLDVDAPMAQIFRSMSTECWSRCELFVRKGMPKLFASPLHTGHATGNSTTCRINILGPNRFSVTLSREYEVRPLLPSLTGGFSTVIDREKLLARFILDWTIAPCIDSPGRTYKALLRISMPDFTAHATPKDRWKVRKAMTRFK